MMNVFTSTSSQDFSKLVLHTFLSSIESVLVTSRPKLMRVRMVGSYDSKDESENKKLILAKFDLILKTFQKDNVGAFSPGSIVLKRPTEVVM